jgi:flagellin
MALVINTNVMSLNAQRNLTTSGNQLAQSLQRLSSGLRINSAKDDAAGLAISERMTTQINGLGQAARNANDGISLAQTSEGALQEVTNNLQRIRELSVQAANATNSASDLAALDQEVQQRLQEIDRIASQTSFNGRKVLDGSFGSATFQVGANVGETIAVGLSASMKTSDIGQLSSTASASLTSLFASGAGLTLATGDLTIDGTSVVAGNYTTAAGLAAAINTAAGSTVATVSGNEIAFSNATGTAITIAGTDNPLGITTVAAQSTAGAGLTLAAGELSFNGTDVTGSFTTAAGLVTAINAAAGSAVASVTGNEITITNTSTSTAVTVGGTEAAALGFSTVAAATPAGLTLAAGELSFNGTDVTGTFTTAAALITAINAAAGSTVASATGNEITITNNSTSTPVTVAGTEAAALGFSTVAAVTATTISSTGTAATMAANAGVGTALGGAGFTVQIGSGSATQVASATYNDAQDLADAINAAATTSAGTATTIATVNGGGELVITNNSTSGAITLAGADLTTLTLGTTVAAATATTDVSTAVNAGVTVAQQDGTDISTAVNAGVTASGTTTPGAATTTGVNAAVTATGTPTDLTLAAGAFTLAVGDGTAFDLQGSYSTGQELADAINSNVVGAFAQFNSTTGVMSISSGEELTVNGTAAGTGATNLGFGTVGSAVAVSGDLNSVNVLSKANADDAILRMDAALTSVSTLRSTLGAIQNRFQSTINSLQAVSENLSASRSRIQDTDFASETAALTRAQILQQAGTAMVAQANSAPQNVLSLLRG